MDRMAYMGDPAGLGQDAEELLPSTGLTGQGEERVPDNCWALCEGTQPGHGAWQGGSQSDKDWPLSPSPHSPDHASYSPTPA